VCSGARGGGTATDIERNGEGGEVGGGDSGHNRRYESRSVEATTFTRTYGQLPPVAVTLRNRSRQ
jgi:hypothetical protein